MVTPWEKDEYKYQQEWLVKVKKGELDVIPCISGWMDVCGFGSALERSSWNLIELQKHGLLELLSSVYQRVGHPFLVGVEPMLSENVLVINDGVARTVDLGNIKYANGPNFIFYLRDLFLAHLDLLELTQKLGYGIRTVIAGGERVQYSPTIYTGNSVLQHDEINISEYGRKLLAKNFLYNPAEFQMNTAFAKAYSIDSLGSKSGININGCYVESSFWDLIEKIPDLKVIRQSLSNLVCFKDAPALEVYFTNCISVPFKGIEMQIGQVGSFRVDAEFEGEETICDISKCRKY